MNTGQVTRFGVDVRAPGEAELGDEAMSEICTTLRDILAHDPCGQEPGSRYGWQKLLRHLGKKRADDEPIPFRVILESNGLDDALWATRTRPDLASTWRLLAVRYARRVQHLMADPRSVAALDVAERHVRGDATDEEMKAAAEAAASAASAAWWSASAAAAWSTASASWSAEAAWSAEAVASAASAAAKAAAWSTAWATAAARAAAASAAVEVGAAWSAAVEAERQWQAEEFLRVVSGEVKP
jgi:hypothetical protein